LLLGLGKPPFPFAFFAGFFAAASSTALWADFWAAARLFGF
jgi:hypothetical protein